MNELEMEMDAVLENIETINALIYDEVVAIERLQKQLEEME